MARVDQAIDFRCPACGAPLSLDEKRGVYVCDYCGTTMPVNDPRLRKSLHDEKKFEYFREENEEYEAKYEAWRKLLAKWLVLLGVLFMPLFFLNNSRIEDIFMGLFTAALIFGGAAVAALKPRRSDVAADPTDIKSSPKSRTVALVLNIIFGWLGAHNFYAGKIGLGLLYLLSFGLFGIGWAIDFGLILAGRYRDKNGRVLRNW